MLIKNQLMNTDLFLLTVVEPVCVRHWSANDLQVKPCSLTLRAFT